MRLIETYRAYRALSPEQRRILKEKRIEGERTPAEWVTLLAGLAAYDRQADAVRTRAAVLMVVAPLLVFFASLFGSLALGYEDLAFLGALGLALLVAVPLVAVFLATRSADLANQLREVAIPLVALIGDDLGSDGTLRLGLDLRGGAVKAKLREERPPFNERGRSIRERVFLDPWMTGTAALNDGSRLRWSLTDEVRERRISRRNARGKTKTKTKYRIRSLAEVALDLPVALYRLRAGATASAAGIRASSEGKWLKLRGRQCTRQKDLEPRSAPLKDVLRSITGLYALAEPIAKQEPRHV